MRQFVRALRVVLLLGFLSGCSGEAGPLILPPFQGAAIPPSETALPASSFNDSIGVNLHMTYGHTPYDTQFDRWSPILIGSRIQHIRDAVCLQAESWFCPTEAERLNMLASNGIHAGVVSNLDSPLPYISNWASAVNGAIEAYEGPNECDAGYCSSNWASIEGAFQQQLYKLASPAVKIVGPSMTTQNGYAALGNLTAYMDFGNIHDYVATNEPETPGGAAARLSWVGAVSGSKPVWSTEFGYSTDPSYANNGVPEIIQERYLPRALFEHLRLGIMRTYIYQLFDYGTDGGYYMGLLRADYSPKPAWKRLLQLMQYFNDGGTSPQQRLSYTVSGDASGVLDHVLFQRSDGTFLLALWLANSVYDPSTHAVASPARETITLTVPSNVTSATLTQFNDGGQVQSRTLEQSGGAFQVPVTSLVSVLSFHV